jgi:hypothetical protein
MKVLFLLLILTACSNPQDGQVSPYIHGLYGTGMSGLSK